MMNTYERARLRLGVMLDELRVNIDDVHTSLDLDFDGEQEGYRVRVVRKEDGQILAREFVA